VITRERNPFEDLTGRSISRILRLFVMHALDCMQFVIR